MPIILPQIDQISKGDTTQCDFFDKVKEIILLTNELRTAFNQVEPALGDIASLTPSTNISQAILDLRARIAQLGSGQGGSSAIISDPDGIVTYNSTTGELDFNLPALTAYLEN